MATTFLSNYLLEAQNLIDYVSFSSKSLLNGNYLNTVYEYVSDIPLYSIVRENIVFASMTFYLLWYVRAYLSKTELITKEGSFMHQMLDKFSSIHSGYRPTIWCFTSTLNTIVYAKFQGCIKQGYQREILKTQDGGCLAIDWSNMENSDNKHKMILLVLPGLTGCSRDNYVTHLVEEGKKVGLPAVVMNYRGIEVELKTPRTYCAANYEDLHLVITHIRERFKDYKIFAVGISLGGIKLGGYLAKHYDDCPISYSMIVSAPMNVFYSCKELERTHNFFVFNRVLTRNLSRYFTKYKHLFEADEKYDCKSITEAISIRDFDTKFVAKQFGYESCEAYYQDSCLDAKIQNIKIPTLFLNASDDMFSPERAFPIEKIKSNPYTAMVVTKYGGHISFCEGLIPYGCNYTCRILRDYLAHVLDDEFNNSQTNAILKNELIESNK